MDDINKTTSQDIAYATTKAVVGSIPLVGAAAGELLGLIVASPLEKRKNKFLTEIGQRLKDLEEANKIDLSSLTDNQQFVDTVLQATTYALKTSEEEKLLAFKNAILNTALNDSPDMTRSQIFLNLIDNFTIWHIRILFFSNDPKEWYNKNNKPAPENVMAGLNSVINDAFPELKGQNELVNLIWADLKRAGLHNSSDMGTIVSSAARLSPKTTDMGRQFMKFIM